MCSRDKLTISNLTETRQKALVLFGNLDDLHDFHASIFYPELERCGANPAAVGRTFLSHCTEFRSLYSAYCQNMPSARQAISDLGGENNPASILHHCQTEAGHQLPLSSYLLKPMQRLTKYQLLLKDLVEASNVVCGKAELEEALNELLSVIKTVNDSLHSVTIRQVQFKVLVLQQIAARWRYKVRFFARAKRATFVNKLRSQCCE